MDGLFFALTVACLATSFDGRRISAFDRLGILAGKTSYSMHLLHTFWVFSAARWIHAQVWPISGPQWGMAIASLLFLASLPVAMLSYCLIELPILCARKPCEARALVTPAAISHAPDVAQVPGEVRRAS